MKNILLIILCGVTRITIAQDSLDVSYSKTTSLVFEYPIVNVDRGSKDILAQRVQGTDNAIQVKAARRNFSSTNLTIFTQDGNVHELTIHYSDTPIKLVYQIPDNSHGGSVKLSNGVNTKFTSKLCDKTLFLSGHSFMERKTKNKISLGVKRIRVNGEFIFYHLIIRNKSHIPFNVESLRFSIRDNEQVKRTATQEVKLLPVYIHNEKSTVEGESEISVIYVLKTLVISDTKRLEIELLEKGDGRNLKLFLRDRDILQAKPIF
jgi:conjugative transposon TraN protein